MDKHNETNKIRKNKEENWVDDLMEKQKYDLEEEEEILSGVPNRIKHKYLDEEL